MQAVKAATGYVAEGWRWVVDIDLEKFFDRVNHDVLMARVARRVKDKRLLGLMRRYLQAGVMKDGLETVRTEGTPQGGPLSPLLSNILLDDLDKELERRGHRFCRYADDCNIYVRSNGRESGSWRRSPGSWRSGCSCGSIATKSAVAGPGTQVPGLLDHTDRSPRLTGGASVGETAKETSAHLPARPRPQHPKADRRR